MTVSVAVLSNSGSERNKRGMAEIEACLAGRPGVEHVRFEPGMNLRAALTGLAACGVNLLVINSGDGLVHGVLGALLEGSAFPKLPLLAILPRGMTNMTAADVGLGGRDAATLNRLLDLAGAGGIGRYLVRRRVLKVDYDPAKPPERGMFFGAAGIYDAIQLCTGRMYKLGLKGAWANAVTLLTVLGRGLFRGTKSLGLGGEEIGVAVDGAPLDTRRRALVLATTLDRLVLGSRPFWKTGDAPVRFSVFDHPAVGLVRYSREILYGGNIRWLPDPPYHSTGARRVELHLAHPFTIDGEFYHPAAGVPVVITADEAVQFVKLPA